MGEASRLIRRDAMVPDGSPKKQELWMRLERLGFQAVEQRLCTRKDAGVEN